MLSAIVLVPETASAGGSSLELVARSLVWLVSAAVAGVIKDVVLAGPDSAALGDLADLAGCAFVGTEHEGERLRQAFERARGDTILLLRAGYAADRSLIDDLESRLPLSLEHRGLRILATPATLLQRLLPNMSSTVGLVAPRGVLAASPASSFTALCAGGIAPTRLATRLRPLA